MRRMRGTTMHAREQKLKATPARRHRLIHTARSARRGADLLVLCLINSCTAKGQLLDGTGTMGLLQGCLQAVAD
ncbi:hypothetical protein EJ06DRAFT_346968 [Trichodelitschia bisporula]|uniref:Uncharacterized protein n=1 Tax=Trichodelitschia bisporula TaxID=703511 RepID=A0A6G1I3A4_9PEZI|nr:hypothetical protein EJ06DRAFT_346968 [Trichodelitschia bisporula]